MSGGVDSSTAAWLLREAGHEVIGLFMRHGQALEQTCRLPAKENEATEQTPGQTPNQTAHKQGCCSEADAEDARRVAHALDIPFYAVNFEHEFGRIVDYFVDQYTAGRTPNPCIVCNTWLKFGKLFDYADSVGADYVATGHYARLVQRDGQLALCRGVDSGKDQAYVLFGIRRSLLSRLLFPVGEHHKDEIRDIAARLGLRVAEKRDSQEICFVPDNDHARFVRQRRGDRDTSGQFVTTEGQVVGHHDGIERFTIGQRKGLGLAFGEPRYVVRIEPDTRRVVLGTKDELACDRLTASEANWLVDVNDLASQPDASSPPCETRFRCEVKIRYRSPAYPATVEVLADDRFRVRFDEPCHGVAPGQAAVCYQDDRVLGGGWID